MNEDKLDYKKMFTDRRGLDHRTSVTLNLDPIKDFFEKQSYEVLDLNQKWRNIYGHLRKNNQEYFLKLASTVGIGSRTINEVAFNNQFNQAVERLGIHEFVTPKISETGYYNELFYYIAEYCKGQLLYNKETSEFQKVDSFLQVIKLNKLIISLDNFDLPRDDEYVGLTLQDRIQDYYKRWTGFYDQVKEFGLQEIFNKLTKIERTFAKSLNHCDFTPAHIIHTPDQIILIDSEHASNFNPKYYDVAYFFHRTYTSAKQPNLAKKYLTEFRQSLDKQQIAEFDRMIEPILAARIIGGFWDNKNGGHTDFTIHDQIKKEYLAKELY